MNKLISFFLLSTLLTFSSCKKNVFKDCQSIIDNKHVIAFYPFSNGSFNDFSGEGHHLQSIGSPQSEKDRSGNANCALSFDNLNGNTQYLFTNQSSFLNDLDEFSISLWYSNSDTLYGLPRFFVNRGEGWHCPDREGNWSLGIFDCNKAIFAHKNSVWEEMNDFSNCSTFAMNQWKHVVATYNKTPFSIKIYVNGELQESENSAADCTNQIKVEDVGDLFIGKKFTGILDDIIIFDEALSSADVKQLKDMGTCCSN